ncbi:MAG: DUF1097 domain-containing protein [Methylococcaceae bacterium]
MNSLVALSASIALLGGVATFLAVGPLAGIFLIWAATIAWAAYFAFGGTKEALKNTIVCGSFGTAMAWLAALEITTIPADAPFSLMAAIAVALSVFVMCLAAKIPALATIPASVLGYSATFAYLLQTPDKLSQSNLLHISLSNPLLLIPVSFVVGGFFGLWSAQLSAKFEQYGK